VNPRINHRDFLRAVGGMVQAYTILSASIAEALPPQLAAVAAVDPVTRITLEQFGDPLVRWFGRGSQLRGVHLADGTLVFGDGDSDGGAVRFIEGLAAEHDDQLPQDWRERSVLVGRIEGGTLELA
jgi:hypothetical protein